MLGVRTADAYPPKQIRLVIAGVQACRVMKHLTYIDAMCDEFGARGLDVRDDQVQALRGARGRRGDVLAKDDGASGARRRELDHAEVVVVVVIGVEPPPEPFVELLRAIDI